MIRQQPLAGRVTLPSDRNRPPLDPFPILQMTCRDYNNEVVSFHRVAPFVVLHVSLWDVSMSRDLSLVCDKAVAPAHSAAALMFPQVYRSLYVLHVVWWWRVGVFD